MLALYIVGGIVTYLGIGAKAADLSIEHNAKEGVTEKGIEGAAVTTLFMWPLWLVMEAPNIFFKKRIKRAMLRAKEHKIQEAEIEKLLLEEDL